MAYSDYDKRFTFGLTQIKDIKKKYITVHADKLSDAKKKLLTTNEFKQKAKEELKDKEIIEIENNQWRSNKTTAYNFLHSSWKTKNPYFRKISGQ